MTKPKKYAYQIQYTDNTYRIVEWIKEEYETVCMDMAEEKRVVAFKDGIFVLTDIRAIVSIPEVEEEKQDEKQDDNLTEWGFVDYDTAQWLRAQGIDVSEVDKGGTN